MSDLEQELLKLAHQLIRLSGQPGRDYVGNPTVELQVGHLKLQHRLGLSDTPWSSMVVLHCDMPSAPGERAIYQEGNERLPASGKLVREAFEFLGRMMVLDRLADV